MIYMAKESGSFPDINGKIFTDEENIIEILYKPCLKIAKEYVRGVGYFRSNVWNLMDEELLDFILRDKNNKMTLLTSIAVQPDDYDAVSNGKKMSYDVAINTLREMMDDENLRDVTKMLTAMIGTKQLEIYVVIREGTGIYHNKTGFFKSKDDILVFEGSGNETKPALSPDYNESNADNFTIYKKSTTSNDHWKNDQEKTIQRLYREMKIGHVKNTKGTYSTKIENIEKDAFPEMNDEDWELKSHRQRAAKRSKEKMKRVIERLKQEKKQKIFIEDVEITSKKTVQQMIKDREHQENALKKWEKNNFKGILKHATGSGKTITALAAIDNHLKEDKPVILVVPDSPLMPMWEDEIIQNLGKGVEIVKFGNDEQSNLDYIILDELENDGINEGLILLFLRKTFVSNKTIINNIIGAIENKNLGNVLFVCDECHSLGTEAMEIYSKIEFGKNLGLSATPERGDEGDKIITKILGNVIDEFSLKDAMDNGYLTPYEYNLESVTLTSNEMKKYEKFRKMIGMQISKKNKGISDDLSAIYRARNVIKQAIGKEDKAIEILKENYQKGQFWIVYASPGEMLRRIRIRIREELGIDAWEYTSKNKRERDYEMRNFERDGGIMLGIKCLDQGVNIPSLTHGIILASTTKEREFIQRRGRLLRGAPGKDKAHIWDIVTLPTNNSNDSTTWSIIGNEIERIEKFGKTSLNSNKVEYFIQKIKLEYKTGE